MAIDTIVKSVVIESMIIRYPLYSANTKKMVEDTASLMVLSAIHTIQIHPVTLSNIYILF